LLNFVVSCSAHLQSISRSLFKRAIIQSGACIGVAKPLDLNHKYHVSRFARLTKALSLDHLSTTEKIEKLRVIPWEHLIEASGEIENPDGMFCITADHDLGGFFQSQNVDNSSKSLIIGNTRHDVLVRYPR
jgi:carboxylesterase type B